MSKKHIFFIEGGDNVGKTTTISTIKLTQHISRIKYNRLEFSKYPTYKATDAINILNRQLKEVKEKFNSNTISIVEYDEKRSKITKDLINAMIEDMSTVFTSLYDDYKDISNYNYMDTLTISDRGFLSTYLYQYKSLPEASGYNELEYLKKFVNDYVPETENEMSIIILNNNANYHLDIDESETIEYKRDFDHDVELQSRINNSLKNIVKLIKEGKLNEIPRIKFYYIDIFNESGRVRKTPDQICEEIVGIINKED